MKILIDITFNPVLFVLLEILGEDAHDSHSSLLYLIPHCTLNLHFGCYKESDQEPELLTNVKDLEFIL